MIADDLAAASPVLRRFLNHAHIVRVPFAIYPWDDSDGTPGLLWPKDRIPESLNPRDSQQRYITEWARPPFPVAALVSHQSEKGLLLVLSADTREKLYTLAESIRPLDPRTASLNIDLWLSHYMVVPDATWEWSCFCILVGVPYPDRKVALSFMGAFHSSEGYARRSNLSNHFYRVRDEPNFGQTGIASVRDESMQRLLAQAIMNREEYSVDGLAAAHDRQLTAATIESPTRSYILSYEHATLSAVTAFGLLACRNIRSEAVVPALRLQEARKRRGQLPLYRYHVLKVYPRMTRAGDPSGTGEDVAVHFVRGHFKEYGGKGLFGKYPGRYWWAEHHAGTAPRFVDKDYELPE